MMRKIPAAFFVFLLAFAPAAQAAEKTAVGDVCSGDQSRADWDAIFQCVSSQFKRAALWLGSSSDTCDSGKAGLLQWTGTSFQACDSSNWTTFASGNAQLYLGSSTASTNPRRSDDLTTGLFSATASTISVATAGVEALRITASGYVGIGTTTPEYPLDVAGVVRINNYGTMSFTEYNGNTYSRPGMFIAESATPFVGDSITANKLFLGMFVHPKITTTNTTYTTEAYGFSAAPTIDGSAAGARVGLVGGRFNAIRDNANDLSSYANNYLYGLNIYAGHNAAEPSTAVSGTVHGVSSFVLGSAGTITTAYGFHNFVYVGDASGPANPVIGTYYGLMLEAPIIANGGTVTNLYGIYQDSATAKNYFAGSVGIGTTAPSTKLHIVSPLSYGTAVSDVLRISGNYDGSGTPSNPSTVGSIAWTDEYYSAVFGRINVVQDNPYASDHSHMEFWTRFDGTAAEKVRITYAGAVGIGTTSPSYLLHVNGTAYATGAAGALSDARHKNNVKNLTFSGLEAVTKLRPVTFEWKDPKDEGMKGEQVGFIAQEVEKILPQVVLTEPNAEKTKGLKYTEMIPVLTKAIQELVKEERAENAALKARIKALEDRK